jgi:hypothetical protein
MVYEIFRMSELSRVPGECARSFWCMVLLALIAIAFHLCQRFSLLWYNFKSVSSSAFSGNLELVDISLHVCLFSNVRSLLSPLLVAEQKVRRLGMR